MHWILFLQVDDLAAKNPDLGNDFNRHGVIGTATFLWKGMFNMHMPHIHEKVDFTVEAFIVFNNKVLLRKHDKYKLWLSIGGHIELDEDPIQAILREVKEEVGLDVELVGQDSVPSFQSPHFKELLPPVSMNRHRINEHHEHISLVYFARAKTDAFRLSERELTEGCRWFSREDLDDPSLHLQDNIRFYAMKALETCGK